MNNLTSLSAGRELKLIKIGNSTGVVLPKELLERIGLAQGDSVSVSADGDGLILKPHDAEFAEQMAAAREVMARRRKALRELAK